MGYADGILYHPRCHDQKVWIMDGDSKDISAYPSYSNPFSFCIYDRDAFHVSLKKYFEGKQKGLPVASPFLLQLFNNLFSVSIFDRVSQRMDLVAQVVRKPEVFVCAG